MAGIWRNDPATREGKYLVLRRDGTQVEWPSFILGARDPVSPHALEAYADVAADFGMDPQYVRDIRALAAEFTAWRAANGDGDPDAPRHRADDPETVARMRGERRDDGEPITAEWLASVGFEPVEPASPTLKRRRDFSDVRVWPASGGGWGLTGHGPLSMISTGSPRTRGDVRLMFRAMGARLTGAK